MHSFFFVLNTFSFKVSIALLLKVWKTISFHKHMAASDWGGGLDSTRKWMCQALAIQQPQT